MVSRKRHLRHLLLLLLALVLVLGVAACGGGDDDPGEATPPAADDDGAGDDDAADGEGEVPEGTYKIGFVQSLTGRLTFYDGPFGEGMQAAIARLNEEGGIDGRLQLELVVRDGQSDPAAGAVAARELVAEGVQFAVTPCDADIGIPAAQIFAQSEIPVVMSCGSGWTFPTIVGEYAFNNVFGTAAMGAAQAEWAIEQGHTRACDLSSNDYFYGKNTSDVFQARFEELGGEIVCNVFYTFDDTDFRAIATQISNANPDIVTSTLVFPGSTTFLRQTRAAGYNGPFIWADSIDSDAARGAGDALNNVYFTSHACPTEDSVQEFYEAYEEQTGEAPDASYIAVAGDLVLLIQEAIRNAGSTEGPAVRDAFANLRDVQGVSGTISYADAPLAGNPVKNVHIVEWVDGEQECGDSFYPEEIPEIR
jgi:branched-chain amino acid transport system substrate-binding protein